MRRIKVAQPAVALNSFTHGKRENAILKKNRAKWNVPARRYNMGQGFTFDVSENQDILCVLNQVATIAQCNKLESLVINCHGSTGFLLIGDKVIDFRNVGVFSILTGLVNKIYIVACKVANDFDGKKFCSSIAANSGATVYASESSQVGVSKIFSSWLPVGKIDDFEGMVLEFNPNGTYSISKL